MGKLIGRGITCLILCLTGVGIIPMMYFLIVWAQEDAAELAARHENANKPARR